MALKATIVSVITVTWNSASTLALCLDSIYAQTGNFTIETIVVDNASTDASLEIARSYSQAQVISNPENYGFCKANNQGISLARGDFILLLNPDAHLTPGYIDAMLELMHRQPDTSLATGKVMRMSLDGSPILRNGLPVIDSVGIRLERNRQSIDIGSEEVDRGQYDHESEVDSVCGAVCFCRTEALEQAKIEGQVFDENYFAYKEDIDLAWRLRRLGWRCLYIPHTTAYHARGWQGGAVERRNISPLNRYHSFKNRRLTILKNETFAGALPNLPFIFGFELAAFIYVIFRERFLFKAYATILKELPRVWRWRKAIKQKLRDRSI